MSDHESVRSQWGESSRSNEPGSPRLRRSSRLRFVAGAVIATAASVPLLTGCLDGDMLSGGPEFEEGDCVKVIDRVIDSDMESASCSDAAGTFDPEERIYRVDSIIDDTEGGCPPLQGFFPVEFIHEPDGVTYCLVQET